MSRLLSDSNVKVRDVAMGLARHGYSSEEIREQMRVWCEDSRGCTDVGDPSRRIERAVMIEELTRQAAVVKAEHDELGFAKRDKQKAQVEFLRAVVEAVRPALPALCSRVQNIPGPIVRALNVAHNLYLGESGGWIEVRDGGSMLLRRTSEEIVVDHVVEDIADALSIALTSHAGSREGTTAEIRHEAERLRAAVMLLRPVPR